MRRHPYRSSLACAVATLALAVLPAQDLRISEFQAINDTTLVDADEETSDWIEIENAGAVATSVGGHFLTDDPRDLRRWRLPDIVLEPGEFLLVFASGKDRRDPAFELHANFRLSGDGEFLALVAPDGETVLHAYAPEFPEQFDDLSYGLAVSGETTTLAEEAAAGRYLVPTSQEQLGEDWTSPGFDDAAWQVGAGGLGYDLGADPGGGGGELRNVASGKAATQSSTGYNAPAGLAVDGDLGNFTHTAAGENLPATWEVDLGEVFAIDSIVLHNRQSCCRSRLRDIRVLVLGGTDGRTVVYESDLLNPENVLAGGTTNGPSSLLVDVAADSLDLVLGRRVRVVREPDPELSGSGGAGNPDEPDVLSLAEVEVFARDLPASYASLITTDLEAAMAGVNASVFVRIPFTLDEGVAGTFDRLLLRVRYDDGFVAFLNGVEIARRNAPPVATWNGTATLERPREDVLLGEVVDLSSDLDLLRAGDNVLALQGLNVSATDGEFLLTAGLEGSVVDATVERFFEVPTPGAVNSEESFDIVEDTRFSIDRGFYETPFDVVVSTATPGATIRYTTDGSWPTETHGAVYSAPIRIDRTTVLRAAAFHPELEPTNVDTQTYIFLEDVIRQDVAATLAAGFPPSWGGTSPDYGMDPDVIGQGGQDRYGGKYAATIRDDLLAIPTLSIVLDIDDMFGAGGIYTNSGGRGLAWERACSAELIHPDGSPGFQLNCGIRIQGGAFRSHGLTKKHSLRLLFKGIYGPTKLRYPLFGPDAVDRFDTITLRSNANDGWQWQAAGDKPLYVRDSFARETVLDMGGVASHETFVHLYINGVYWGLYNPVERPDNSFSAMYFGGDKETWDAISNNSVSEGSRQAWDTLNALAGAGLASDEDYFFIQGKNPDGTDNPALQDYLDVDNLIDYMICNIYGGNSDWPRKNYWVGRDRVDSTGFKFYMCDAEWTLDLRSSLTTDRTGVGDGVAQAYAACRSNEEFRVRFGDRVHRHFFHGGALHVDPANPRWDPENPQRNRPAARFVELVDRIDRAIVAESARWGDQHEATPYTRDEHWEVERDDLLDRYFPARSKEVLEDFVNAGLYPRTAAPVFSRHGGAFDDTFELSIVAESGTIYYTTTGDDPRLLGGGVRPGAQSLELPDALVLVPPGAPGRMLVPSDGSLGLSWTAADFDDAAWLERATGVGYERSSGYEDELAQDDEALLFDIHPSLYVRVPFFLSGDEVDSLAILRLLMKYDDGFVAYVNGLRVASRNAPGEAAWDDSATTNHSDAAAQQYQSFDISEAIPALREGRNVLAIQGLNASVQSSDLLILPELRAVIRSDPASIALGLRATVSARTRDGVEWSALNEATFVHESQLLLRISELMYHPRDPASDSVHSADDFEFIELVSLADRPVELAGYRLRGAVEFDFASASVDTASPGVRFVVVRDREAFAGRYDDRGVLIVGEYSGNLSNDSETVTLVGPLGEPVLEFTYRDDWFPETDGRGLSLTSVDPAAPVDDWSRRDRWAPGSVLDGTPGLDDSGGAASGWQRPGDANQDGRVDVGDAVSLLVRLFRGVQGPLPCVDDPPLEGNNRRVFDANGDATVDAADAVHTLVYLFAQGPPPADGEDCILLEGCESRCSF